MTQLVRAYGQILRFPKEMSDDAISKAILDNEHDLNPDYKPPASSKVKDLAKEYLGVDVDRFSKKVSDSRKSIADLAEESATRGEDAAAPQVPGAPVRQSTYNSALLNDKFGIKPQENLDQSGVLGRIRKTADEDIRGQEFQENLRGAITDAPPEPEGGFIPSAISITGLGIRGAGRIGSDYLGATADNSIAAYGQKLIDENPVAIRGLEDIQDKPFLAVKEALGTSAPTMTGMVGAKALGMGITSLAPLTGPAAPIIAAVGQAVQWLGPAAVAALPSYASIRDKQILNDPQNETDGRAKAIASLGAGAIGVIEQAFGPQQWAMAMLTKEGRAVLARKFAATTTLGAIAKGGLKGGTIEWAEETIQNPIEQLASFDDPTTKESIKETIFAGAMGAIGGGVMGGGIGGVSQITGNRDAQILIEKRKLARQQAEAVNRRNSQQGHSDILNSGSVDEAIQAANNATSKKAVTKDDVLRTTDPTLADIERLTGLKPSESIEQAINQAQQDLNPESIPAQGQQGNVAPNVDIVAQKKPVSQNDANEYAQLINDVEARKISSPDTWTNADEKMLSLAKEKLNSITQPKGNIYEEETSQAPSTKESSGILGNSTEIVLPDNTTLPAQWEIVDADSIKAAIKEGVNQPRDRTRASSDIQIQEISNNLDYRRLSDSPVLDIGAPAISHDGLIVAGNGRFEAVSLAHDKGMASDYLDALKNDAVNKGIDPAVIESMKKPVLVRRITQPYDTRKLAIDSNAGTSLQYSGMELAKIDAERMKGIEDLDITDTGDIALTGSNISKLKQSLGGYNNTELASLVDKNGTLSQDGVRRVRNSLLAKAYGDSDTLGRLVESTDGDARNVLGALTRSAGVVAKVRSDIKAGALPKELDITSNLLDAVETLSQIRAKGQPLEQYLAQDNLFGDDIDADSKEILKFLHENIRSQKKITKFIKNVYDQISNIDQSTEDIFGDNVIPSKQDVMQNAKQSTAGQTAEQQDIFAKQPGKANEQAAKTKASDAGGGKEAQPDTGLNSETNNVIFDRFAELGNKKVSAKESLDDAKKITGIYLDIELEYTKLPDKVPARYNIERRVIQVGYGAEFERSVGAQYLAEELFHAVDAVTRDKAISSSSKRIDIKNGDIYSEVKKHFDNNGKYRDFLDYPLGNNILLSEDVIKIELFARLGVLYQGELEKLKTVLPKTYEAYHGIFGVTKSGIGGEVSSTIWRAGADNKGLNGDASMEVVGQHKPDGEISKANGGLDKSWDSLDVRRLRERISILLKANPSGAKIKFSGEGSLDTKPLFSRSPEERIKDRERAKQLESKLREQGYNFTIQAKDVRDFAAMDRGRQNEAVAAEQIATNFGKRVVWIEAIGDFEINGVMIPSIKDTIFIDVTTDKYARAVMGHELSHHMERDNPDLYKDLVDSLENLIKNHDEYADKYGIEGEDRGYITKEIVGDIMGDNFTDQEFWNKVAEYNTSAFRKIADKIISWLKNLVVKAKSRGLGSEQWVTDAQEAQDIIAKAVAKYTNKKSSLDGLTNKAMFQKAWHGSPFDHDKFDSSKIGTGEGMQAYGFGHYFSDSKHVAEWYKDASSKEGKLYEVELAPKQDEYLLYDAAFDEQSDRVRSALKGKLVANGVDILGDSKQKGADLYKLISQKLDGDKEASQFLHKLGIRGIKYLDGSSIYDAYEAVLSTKKGKYSSSKFESRSQAEQYAKEKREEGFSAKVRFNENANFNYVIFDDKDVSITAKFSKAEKERLSVEQQQLNFGKLNLDYGDIEQRPDTTDKQRSEGENAYQALLERIADRADAKILGLAIARDFKEQGGASLIGQQVRTSDDLATVAQILRDPRYETFRVFYVKDNKIIHHTGVTSRLPGMVNVASKMKGESESDAVDRFINAIAEQKEASGADGYYLLHNHPSGRATPSQGDKNVTIKIANEVPGFISHVVINSNEYSVIHDNGDSQVFQKELSGGYGNDALIPHNALQGRVINSPAVMAEIGKTLQRKDGFFTLLGLSAQNKILSISEIPLPALDKNRTQLLALLRSFARNSGAVSMAAVTNPDAVMQFREAVESGALLDVVDTDGNSLRLSESAKDPTDTLFRNKDRNRSGIRAEQDIIPETINIDGVGRPTRNSEGKLIHPTEDGIRDFWGWFENSKVVDEQGMPKVVYHGTDQDITDFDKEKLGFNTNAQSAKGGFYFTNNARAAARYPIYDKGLLLQYGGMIPKRPKQTQELLKLKEEKTLKEERLYIQIRILQDEYEKEKAEIISALPPNIAHSVEVGLNYGYTEDADVESVRAKLKSVTSKIGNLHQQIRLLDAEFRKHPVVLKYSDDVTNAKQFAEENNIISKGERARKQVQKILKSASDIPTVTKAEYYAFENALKREMPLDSENAELVSLHNQALEFIPEIKESSDWSNIYEFSKQSWAGGNEDDQWDAKKDTLNPNIMPVYLALKNPLIHEQETAYRDKKYADLIEEAKAGEHDGLIIKNTKDPLLMDVYVAFEPNQIKSAIGNTGAFSSKSDDIRFSKAEKQKEPLISESRFRKFQRFWQDDFNRFVAMKEWLADRGINLSEQADVSRAEERYHSKVANQIEDFNDFVATPLIEKIAKAGFSMSDVADYLEAQHAEEANSAIAKLHKDPSMTAYGITNDEAEDYLSKAPKELGVLANEFRNITEKTKKLLLDEGLRSQEEVDAWEAAYKHYIPVKGGDQPAKGTGKGLSVQSKTKRRLGHGRRDEAVIENILLDHNRAVIEVEKNRIAKHLGMMAAEIAMPELMTIGQPVKRKVLKNTIAYEVQVKGVTRAVFDSREGANVFKQMLPATDKKIAPSEITINPTRDQRIISSASPMLAENEINMYIDGHAIRIQINDEIAARAYKHLGIEGYGHLVAAGRAINGYLSKAYTGYAPEWGISNIIRDFTAGIINLTGEEGIVMAAKAVKNYPGSFASLLRYAFTGRKKSNKWIDMYRANGGNTGAAWLPDMERLSNDVASEYAAFQGVISNLKQGDMANASRAALRKLHNVFLKWLNNLNQASENAMRLAAFRAMIESGKSVNEASHISKNITINFNKKGEFGQTANAAYLFFNATMNGQAAMNHALFKGKHKYQAWALGGAGLTALGYTMAAMLGGGDEDEYDKLDDYTKERNMVIKSGDGWIKIPVPYGHGFFWSLGRSIADAQRKDELGALPWHIASSAIEELTPFGSIVVGSDEEFKSDQVLLGLLPTVAQIAVQPALNKSIFSGGEMMPESPFDKSQPDREKMWRGTKGTMYDKTSGWLKDADIDVSPETLKHLTRSATGGAGATADAVISAAMLKTQGAEMDANEVPFVRKLYHEPTIRSDRAAFHKAREEAITAAEEFRRAKRDNDLVSINKILKDKKEMLMLDNYANKLQKFISIERDKQDAVRTNESIPIAERRLKLKELETKEAKFYDQYLDVFKTKKDVMKERSK